MVSEISTTTAFSVSSSSSRPLSTFSSTTSVPSNASVRLTTVVSTSTEFINMTSGPTVATDQARSTQIPKERTSYSPSWPFNFTFGGISPSDLYLPEDTETNEFFSSAPSLLNLTSTTPDNLSLGCSPNTTFCHESVTKIFTDDDLWAENEIFARKLIPAMVFIGILMVFGIIGNLLVVYIYGYRFKSATQHFLIVCLACFDLLMSCIAMPTEIADLRFHHTFSSLFACKLLRFITMFSSISSSFTLVTIATDRHRRVTRPLAKQMTVRRAKIWELVNVLGALFFSWPLLVMTGLRSSETSVPGLLGTDCSFSDDYRMTKYPLAYNVVLGLGFVVLIIVIGILYFRIWKTAKGHRVYMANRTRGSLSGTSLCEVKSNGVGVANGTPTPNGTPKICHKNIEIKLEDNHLETEANNKQISESISPVQTPPKVSSHDDDSITCPQTPVFSESKSTSSSPNECKNPIFGLSCDIKAALPMQTSDTGYESDCTDKITEGTNDADIILKTQAKGNPSIRLKRRSRSLDNLSVVENGSFIHKSSTSPYCFVDKIILSSPTVSHNSLTSSPKLRSRSLKAQPSHCSSIKSDDLRPMSSLLDSVSRSLLSSGTVLQSEHAELAHGPFTSGNDVSTVGNDRSTKNSAHARDRDCNSAKKVGPADKSTGDNTNEKNCNKGIFCNGSVSVNKAEHTDSERHSAKQRKATTEHVHVYKDDIEHEHLTPECDGPEIITTVFITGCKQNLADSLNAHTPVNADFEISTKNDNSTDIQSGANVTGNLPLKDVEWSVSVQKSNRGDNPIRELHAASNTTQLSFLDVPDKSDFAHLMTPRSMPMAIPDDVIDEGEFQTAQSRKLPGSGNETAKSTTGKSQDNCLESPCQSPSLHTRFRSQESRDRSNSDSRIPSMINNNKRRSTVISILEKYRIRTGSMASLDNITTGSNKSVGRRNSKSLDKTTIVAFAISFVFVLSFVPYLSLMFIRSFVKDFDYNLDGVKLCVYNLFLRFYLLNSAVNPLLYGLLNQRFRQECKRLITCRCRRTVKK